MEKTQDIDLLINHLIIQSNTINKTIDALKQINEHIGEIKKESILQTQNIMDEINENNEKMLKEPPIKLDGIPTKISDCIDEIKETQEIIMKQNNEYMLEMQKTNNIIPKNKGRVLYRGRISKYKRRIYGLKKDNKMLLNFIGIKKEFDTMNKLNDEYLKKIEEYESVILMMNHKINSSI